MNRGRAPVADPPDGACRCAPYLETELMPEAQSRSPIRRLSGWYPFRRAVLRGLGVVMPPLLTIVLFIWAWTTIDGYILRPMENMVRWAVAGIEIWDDVHSTIPSETSPKDIWVDDAQGQRVPTARLVEEVGGVQGIVQRVRGRNWDIVSFSEEGVVYVQVADQKWVPETVVGRVKEDPGPVVLSTATTREIYHRYVDVQYLTRWRVIPVFMSVFIAVLYLLGKFLAAGAGRMFLGSMEALIQRLPVVRNVYSAVKQVTDFFFSEREIEFNRVVAIEYPRKGIWSIGFVTGESMLDIRSAANEPVLSVLMPTSPMPATGFTVTVRKSEAVDLNLTVDQAIQFIVSCGVVVPGHQQLEETAGIVTAAIAQRLQAEVEALPPSQTQTSPGYADGQVPQAGFLRRTDESDRTDPNQPQDDSPDSPADGELPARG